MLRAVAGIGILWAVTGYAIFSLLTTEPTTREIPAEPVALNAAPEHPGISLPVTTEPQLAILLNSPVYFPPPPEITVAKDPLCDGLGHCWRWGAWRNPDDSLWTDAQISTTYSAPAYSAPAPSAASATTDSTYSGGSLAARCGKFYPARVEYWASTAAQYDWDLCAWANIVDCESDGDEWIMNATGSGACGVMQHLPCQHLGDGAGSIALGYAKYAERGWQPWTVGGCYPY